MLVAVQLIFRQHAFFQIVNKMVKRLHVVRMGLSVPVRIIWYVYFSYAVI